MNNFFHNTADFLIRENNFLRGLLGYLETRKLVPFMVMTCDRRSTHMCDDDRLRSHELTNDAARFHNACAISTDTR